MWKQVRFDPFAALTAWRALKSTARISEGWWSSRFCPQFSLQLLQGAMLQLCVVLKSIERTFSAGAEQAINYTAEDIELTIKGKFDAVLDTIGVQERKDRHQFFKVRWTPYDTPEYSWTYMRADSEGLEEIRRLSEAGKLKIPVEKSFAITLVREAHEAKDKKIIPGKVVLELD